MRHLPNNLLEKASEGLLRRSVALNDRDWEFSGDTVSKLVPSIVLVQHL